MSGKLREEFQVRRSSCLSKMRNQVWWRLWKMTFSFCNSWSERETRNLDCCGMGNEWESGKGGECCVPFQGFFLWKAVYYKLGLDQTFWDQILALPFISFVTSGKLLNLFVLLFPIWKMRTIKITALGYCEDSANTYRALRTFSDCKKYSRSISHCHHSHARA